MRKSTKGAVVKLDNRVLVVRDDAKPWVLAIDELIGQQKRTAFDIGDLLIGAAGKLARKTFNDVVKASGLRSKQNANNYMRVARAAHLRKPEIFPNLPTSVGALIDLAAWEDREIEFALRDGVIHPQSDRSKLRKWRAFFNYRGPVQVPPEPTAVVVAYIMCDAATYSFERSYELWEKFDEMKLKYLPDDMHITPFEKDRFSPLQRTVQLGNRVWTAYENNPALFIDPRFESLIREKCITSGGSAVFHMKEIASIIASGDHKQLHSIIRFSKSDWKFLGVSNVGYATLLPYLT